MEELVNLEDRHIQYLKKEFGMAVEDFIRICEDDESIEFDELLDILANKECDVYLSHVTEDPLSDYENCPGDLVDFMCGPYEEE